MMISPVSRWHDEHVYYAKLLDLLDGQVAVFHDGGNPDYALMGDAVQYLRFFPDRHHHPREDEAFRRLVRRDPTVKPLVNRLRQEHRIITKVGAALLELLDEAAEGGFIARETIEAAAATYLVYYRAHLAAEEKEVMPRAHWLLTAEDWAAVEHAAPKARDPLFGDDCDERYRELRRRIASAPAAVRT
jgi:hemerythrin-like domain-containing protein